MRRLPSVLMFGLVATLSTATLAQSGDDPWYIKQIIARAMKVAANALKPSNPIEYGSFQGKLVLEAIGRARDFKLVQPFAFTDANRKVWSVPAGTTVDGASIPRAFWTIIGAPWSGPHAKASVIHDYYCEARTQEWKPVHRAFYDAMLANAVDFTTAKIMYWAVYRFGPRWTFREETVTRCTRGATSNCQEWVKETKRVAIDQTPPKLFDYPMVQNEIEDAIAHIRAADPPLSEIEVRADRRLATTLKIHGSAK